jgi:hypothetical protein
MSTWKKKNNNKNLKVGEVSELDTVTNTFSSLVAFVNKTISTKFNSLQDMHEYYQQEATLTTVHKKRCRMALSSSDDDSESSESTKTGSSESIGNKQAKAKTRI